MKDSDSNAALLKLERALYICKAGYYRPSVSHGIRQPSTGRKNCEFKLRIACNSDNKLEVKELNPKHTNHSCDLQTYLHYPENLRLTKDETDIAKTMIQCGANKQKVKINLMTNRESPISLKSLHNLQTKQNKSTTGDDEFTTLLGLMQNIPGVKIKVAYDDENQLIGIFFQDARMAALFEKYPEVVIFDATYRLNDRRIYYARHRPYLLCSSSMALESQR